MTPVSSGHPVPHRATTREQELHHAWSVAEPNWEHHAWALFHALNAVVEWPDLPSSVTAVEVARDAFTAATDAFIAAGNAWSDSLRTGD